MPKNDVTGGTAPFFKPGRRRAAHQELLQDCPAVSHRETQPGWQYAECAIDPL